MSDGEDGAKIRWPEVAFPIRWLLREEPKEVRSEHAALWEKGVLGKWEWEVPRSGGRFLARSRNSEEAAVLGAK